MNIIKAGKKLYLYVLFSALLSAIFLFMTGERAYAHNSKAWEERIDERTGTLWVEGQLLGDLVLNARGELNVTWLERGLNPIVRSDNDVDRWVIDSLGYYFSNNEETRAKLKGRDVFALTYRAVKYWDFDPTKLTIDGYAITPEDILTREEYWESSRLAPGYVGTLTVAAPPVKPGQTVELRYEDAAARFEAPRRTR